MRNLPRSWISRSPTMKLCKAATAPPALPTTGCCSLDKLGGGHHISSRARGGGWLPIADYVKNSLMLLTVLKSAHRL